MATELRKLGATVEEGADFIRVTPPATLGDWRAASIHTYDDHRVAMCFSLAAFNPAVCRCALKTRSAWPRPFLTTLKPCSRSPRRGAQIPVICVDGPTASGKGTLAAVVAQRLGYHFLDSGSLYRITALAATRAGLPIDAEHAAQIATLARQLAGALRGRTGAGWATTM